MPLTNAPEDILLYIVGLLQPEDSLHVIQVCAYGRSKRLPDQTAMHYNRHISDYQLQDLQILILPDYHQELLAIVRQIAITKTSRAFLAT
jgi:hypothetical protein